MRMQSVIRIRLFLFNWIDSNIKDLICVQHTKSSESKYLLFSANYKRFEKQQSNLSKQIFLTQRSVQVLLDFRNLQMNL